MRRTKKQREDGEIIAERPKCRNVDEKVIIEVGRRKPQGKNQIETPLFALPCRVLNVLQIITPPMLDVPQRRCEYIYKIKGLVPAMTHVKAVSQGLRELLLGCWWNMVM